MGGMVEEPFFKIAWQGIDYLLRQWQCLVRMGSELFRMNHAQCFGDADSTTPQCVLKMSNTDIMYRLWSKEFLRGKALKLGS